MAELKKLNKSRREGIMDTYYVARCACGVCGCYGCASCYTNPYSVQQMQTAQTPSNTSSASYYNGLGG